jgi:hypothetical protein
MRGSENLGRTADADSRCHVQQLARASSPMGPRPGEIRWDDRDFENGCLVSGRAVDRSNGKKTIGQGAAMRVFGATRPPARRYESYVDVIRSLANSAVLTQAMCNVLEDFGSQTRGAEAERGRH